MMGISPHTRIVQTQSVHDLVVVVAGRGGFGRPGEGLGIRAFEEDHPAAVLIEIGVVHGIVEGILLVRHDPAGIDPRPDRRVGLGVPDLAQVVTIRRA